MPVTTDLSSKNRLIDLDTPLDKGVLVAERLSGTETLGRMFHYELIALSANGNIAFDDVLGKHVTVLIEQYDGSRRAIDGRVAQIGLVGMLEGLFRYRLVLRPWTWMLTLTTDCKIFQEKNVKEILEEVFADQPDADVEFNLTADYAKRVYCVQYRETDFDFVSRLMEEEGIYYFFRHDKGKHVLVICDAPGAHEALGTVPFMPQAKSARAGREYIKDWSVTREIQPCKTALRDYNFEKPNTDLLVKLDQVRDHAEATHEIYDYPGEYQEVPAGEQIVRSRLEEIQAGYEIVTGSGNARLLACGGTFTFSEFGRQDQNGEYLIISTTLEVTNNLLESSQASAEAGFEVRFQLMLASEPYRSARTTPRPVVRGPQTAVIVGPSGEEIFVDKYGRVKVQFHWDRYGKKDDKSSCWIRVSQIWAGKNYGWMTIPRIGQEVVVDFLEGNPDEPLITGRVYNAEQMPPWGLPDNKTQSGILTRSSAGGSPENANHLKFEDKKGEELIDIHAEKDMSTHVEHDDSTFVGNDQSLVVKRDQSIIIQRDSKEVVTRDRTSQVNNNESHTVNVNQQVKVVGNQNIEVEGNHSEIVKSNSSYHVQGNRGDIVDGNRDETTKGNHGANVDGNQLVTIKGNQTVGVTGNVGIKAAKITFEAGHIEQKVTGGNSLVVESPTGPYTIMANKFAVLSNTDIDLFGIGNINATSMGNNTTVLGPNNSGYVGMASDTNMGLARSTFLGVAIDTFMGAQLSTTLAAQMETVVAAKITTTAGVEIELGGMTMYVPGGGGGGGGATVMSQAATSNAITAVAMGAQVALISSALGFSELSDQYSEARQQLQQAASAAADAGHPGLAARLNRLAATETRVTPFTSQDAPTTEGIDSTTDMGQGDAAYAPKGTNPSTPTTDNTGASTSPHPSEPHTHDGEGNPAHPSGPHTHGSGGSGSGT